MKIYIPCFALLLITIATDSCPLMRNILVKMFGRQGGSYQETSDNSNMDLSNSINADIPPNEQLPETTIADITLPPETTKAPDGFDINVISGDNSHYDGPHGNSNSQHHEAHTDHNYGDWYAMHDYSGGYSRPDYSGGHGVPDYSGGHGVPDYSQMGYNHGYGHNGYGPGFG